MGDLADPEDLLRDSEELLRQTDDVLANSITPGLTYYLVAHDLWGAVNKKFHDGVDVHLQFVPKGASPHDTAGKAASWLYKNNRTITRLVVIAHGKPGQFFLGREIKGENVGQLVGWLADFFKVPMGFAGIQIVGCNAAADSIEKVGQYYFGQIHPADDPSMSHRGFELLKTMARAANVMVEGPLHALSQETFELKMTCRRVAPAGWQTTFVAGGVKEPGA